MGLLFTIIYIFTALITPTAIFGSFADYHIEVILAIFTLVFSLLSATKSGALRMPQTFAIFGLTASVCLSILFAGLAREVPSALLEFIPAAAAFFFIIWNVRTKRHLEVLVAILVLIALFVVYRGYLAQAAQDPTNLYVYTMHNTTGELIFRIRGLGIINDPNDLAQFIAGLIPCAFFLWKKDRLIRNLLFVYLPVSILLYGMYLTHSRGGMIALMAATVVAGRRKIGTAASAVGGGVVFAALSAAGWTAGREVSASAGADRTEAWATGLTLIRSHPLFGVGYLRFTEYFYITAHNTIIVCAAEIGLIGFFFWIMFIFTTLHDLVTINKVRNSHSSRPASIETLARYVPHRPPTMALSATSVMTPAGTPSPLHFPMLAERAAPSPPELSTASSYTALHGGEDEGAEQLAATDLQRIARLLTISFAGFLAAGWFLSRSYTMLLFINTGMAAAVYRMASEKGLTSPAMPLGKMMRLTAVISAALILVVYVGLRLESFLPK